MKASVIGLATALLLATAVSAQRDDIIPLEKVVRSQRGTVSQKIANTEITIEYGRPVARGRALFGALVPYGRVWHPGADQGTTLQTTRAIELNGKPLPAGRYSLWTVPGEKAWTFIFSKNADAFHTSYPGEALDALRVDLTPETGAHMESMAFYFPAVDGKDATLRLHWGAVVVPMSIKVQ
jgi:hypothetical protein